MLALLGVAGCRAGSVSDPNFSAPGASEVRLGESQSSNQAGALHITKDCTGYSGLANQTCKITSSNVKAIPAGSIITYFTGADAAGVVNTDIVIDPPGHGDNVAYGHCTINLGTGTGVCRLSGGTGKFSRLQARIDVTPLGWPNFAWDGTYSYSN
jgi:hypothetical protein